MQHKPLGRVLILISLLALSLAFSPKLSAAEETSGAPAESDSAAPAEVTIDTATSIAPGIAPTGFFGGLLHKLDLAAEAVSESLTFNLAAKASLQAKHALERVAEAEALFTSGQSGQAEKLLVRFEIKISQAAATINQSPQVKPAEAGEFLTNFTQTQIEAGRVLDKLADRTGAEEETIVKKALETKDKALDEFSAVVDKSRLSTDALAETLTAGLQAVAGSEFKDFKSLEILKALKDRLPEKAQAGIQRAQENTLRHFERELKDLAEGERGERMQQYLRHLPGMETGQFAVLEEMKNKMELPEEMFAAIEKMKTQAAERFAEKFQALRSEDLRERLFAPVENEGFENLRILEKFTEQIPVAEIREAAKEHQTASLQKFRARFAADAGAQAIAGHAEKLMEQIRENPDPATFKLLNELREQLPAEQREFVQQLESAGRQEFERRAREEGENFFARMADSNPENVEFFHDFQASPEVPEEIKNLINTGLEKQAEHIRARLQTIEHPQGLEFLQSRFESQLPAATQEEILKHQPDFERQLQEKQGAFEERARRFLPPGASQTEVREFLKRSDFPTNFSPPRLEQERKPDFKEKPLTPDFEQAQKRGFENGPPPGMKNDSEGQNQFQGGQFQDQRSSGRQFQPDQTFESNGSFQKPDGLQSPSDRMPQPDSGSMQFNWPPNGQAQPGGSFGGSPSGGSMPPPSGGSFDGGSGGGFAQPPPPSGGNVQGAFIADQEPPFWDIFRVLLPL